MPTVVGLAGSLRSGSYNRSLLRAAAEVAPDTLHVDVASITGIPLYDADLEEANGVPAVVEELKDRIADADGLLLASPEYNNSMPGVFKNAIDWLTRPPKDIGRVFRGKPVALMGATPGGGGTVLAQTAWLQVFRTLGLQPWFDKLLYVRGAGDVFDADGRLVDDDLRQRLETYMAGFADRLTRR